jgi:hypothetical protein
MATRLIFLSEKYEKNNKIKLEETNHGFYAIIFCLLARKLQNLFTKMKGISWKEVKGTGRS